jgi:hypothetical protein
MKFDAVVVWLAFSAVAAPQVVDNPAKPPNLSAGRVVTLKEEMRIEDTGDGFYLKMPMVKVGPDGTIFVRDGQEQVLQFSPEGKFLRNLLKKGQGPGELTQVNEILPLADRVLIQGMPPKILAFNRDGGLIRETGLQTLGPGLVRLFAATGDTMFFHRSGRPDPNQGSGWKDIPQEILIYSDKDQEPKVLATFFISAFLQTSGGKVLISHMSFKSLTAIPFGPAAFAVNETPEHAVKLIDAGSGKITRHFRREYRRVKRKASGGGSARIGGSSFAAPDPPEHQNDILFLHEVDGRIWVQTSTASAKKGILFDVFDAEGRYVDCFYLKYSDKDIDPDRTFKTFTFAGGFVYFSDTTDDDLIVIKKCSLVGLK